MASDQAELPRSVRKGPLITVKCECGQRRDLQYGEQWECDGCGRRYDTRKIPIEEYAAIRRTQIRYRLFPLAAGILLLTAVILFWVVGRAFSAVVAVAFLLASWAFFGRPFFRSRYRRATGQEHPDLDDQGRLATPAVISTPGAGRAGSMAFAALSARTSRRSGRGARPTRSRSGRTAARSGPAPSCPG